MKDSLAFGGACIALLNHVDRVKAACLAQLVNAIAPIMTETGGPAWRQTIFYPFQHMSQFGRGRVLRAKVDSPTYDARYFDPRGSVDNYYSLPNTPYVKFSAVHDEAAGMLTLFALNRHLKEEAPLQVRAKEFSAFELAEALEMHDSDLEAVNTKANPDRIKPTSLKKVKIEKDGLSATLAPASWNVIRLKVAK